MTNLKAYRETDFRYRSADVGEVVTIEVQYDLANTGYRKERGIHVCGWFSNIEDRGDGLMAESFCHDRSRKGFTVLALAQPRRNKKQMLAIAERIDKHVPLIATKLNNYGPDAAIKLVRVLLTESAGN